MTEKITPLGDIHSGRRTQLIENDNCRYIKKPRDFKNEAAFSSFCEGFSKLGIGDFSRTAKLIECADDYHTEEFVENIETTNKGIDLYYARAGVLLFVCYLLFSKDLHCENIIASADTPVIIDLETLLSGKIARSIKAYNLAESVLCTNLICDFLNSKNGPCDISGFSGTEAGLRNVPFTCNGRVFLPDKEEEFINGFKNAYKTALSHKEEVRNLIRLFDNCRFRQILRPTNTYSVISSYIKSADEEKREVIAFSLLSRAYEKDIDKNRLKESCDILAAEVCSVINDEIPLFYTYSNSCDLFSNEKVVMKDFLERSPIDYATDRLEKLSEADLERQIKIIHLGITASQPQKACKNFNFNISALAPGEISASIVTRAAVPGLPSVFCELTRSTSHISMTSCGFSLYSGLMGFLCMYAAMFRKTRKKEYLDLLLKYFESFSDMMLTSDEPITLTDSTASLSNGVGGMIAGLLHISELVEDKSFKVAAEKLTARLDFSKPLINYDYLNASGALPVILSKFENKKILPLCENMQKSLKDSLPYTTGLAHGASGLLLTLAATNRFLPENDLFSVADWEEKYYCEKENNWYDLRDKDRLGFMSGWCSGAPGIGMARKALLSLSDDPHIIEMCNRDIGRVKEYLSAETPCKKDSLCCGAASRLMAASRLEIKTDSLYNQLVEAEKNQNLRLFHAANTNDAKISLMQGLAGIAYALAMYGDALSGGMTV